MIDRTKEFLFELFKNIPRQGPGSEKSTLQALARIKLPTRPHILDVGCGTGNQTLLLAKNLHATITAVDIHQPFLDILFHLAYHLKPPGRIRTINQSMDAMKFPANHFDLIWSEGAIYIMGFENGLNVWKRFLKPGGYMAVSEISWFKKSLPAQVKEFWKSEYPLMKSVQENLKIIEQLNFLLIDHFSLPDSDWWDEFYEPLQERIEVYKKKYKHDLEILSVLYQTAREIDIHKYHSDYYGYEFYIMQNP